MSFNEQFSVAVKHTLMPLQHNYLTGYFLITVIKIIAEHTNNGLMSRWLVLFSCRNFLVGCVLLQDKAGPLQGVLYCFK